VSVSLYNSLGTLVDSGFAEKSKLNVEVRSAIEQQSMDICTVCCIHIGLQVNNKS